MYNCQRAEIVGGDNDETYQNIEYSDIEQYSEKRWMWRMPDIMSVCLQDFLYSRKPDM